MASVNRVTLIGHLTRDPALKYLPNQTPVVEFGLAMNHKFKTASGEQREDVCFVDCAAFGKPAEIINQYCQKGKQIYIEGRLKFDTWEDKQGGGKRSKHSVVVENFQFLGGREGGDAGSATDDQSQSGNAPRAGYARPPNRSNSMAQTAKERSRALAPAGPAFDENSFINDDDIPF